MPVAEEDGTIPIPSAVNTSDSNNDDNNNDNAGPAEALKIWSGNYPVVERMHIAIS